MSAEIKYDLASDSRQKYIDKYNFAPRGLSSLEPGTLSQDYPEFNAFNIAKSYYQINPHVFNLEAIAAEVDLDTDEVAERIKAMYDKHLILYVANPAVELQGFGLYYTLVKLEDDVSKEDKTKLSKFLQEKDAICSGYEVSGDYDFYIGNHMRVLDNLLADVIYPLVALDAVKYVRINPVKRNIRDSSVNLWDVYPQENYAKFNFSEEAKEKFLEVQDKMDAADFAIYEALNKHRDVEDMFNYDLLEEISGIDKDDLIQGIEDIRKGQYFLPLFHLNINELGIKNHIFLVSTFQSTETYKNSELADKLSQSDKFNYILEFTDSFYNLALGAFKGLEDIDAIRAKLNAYPEVESIAEIDTERMYRRWSCRLDFENGNWEQTVFTDDNLLDYAKIKHEQEENK